MTKIVTFSFIYYFQNKFIYANLIQAIPINIHTLNIFLTEA